jgi:transcriptional regulator with XRE-family HTH domain
MDQETRARLEAAGFRFGDAADFLGLTEQERRLVELRVAASRAVRRLREKLGVTQKELAARFQSSQSRVAKIEAAAGDVSLDLMFKALFAAGGDVTDLIDTAGRSARRARKTFKPVKKKVARKAERPAKSKATVAEIAQSL